MVSHLNSFKYIEMDSEFIETPCQTFEVVVATKISSDTPRADKVIPKMVSLKDARTVVEEGNNVMWGQLLDIPFKADKFGLGFTSQAQKEVRRARAGKPPIHLKNHEVNAMEDSDDECAFENWIYPTTEGNPNNWHAKDFTPVSFIEE